MPVLLQLPHQEQVGIAGTLGKRRCIGHMLRHEPPVQQARFAGLAWREYPSEPTVSAVPGKTVPPVEYRNGTEDGADFTAVLIRLYLVADICPPR